MLALCNIVFDWKFFVDLDLHSFVFTLLTDQLRLCCSWCTLGNAVFSSTVMETAQLGKISNVTKRFRLSGGVSFFRLIHISVYPNVQRHTTCLCACLKCSKICYTVILIKVRSHLTTFDWNNGLLASHHSMETPASRNCTVLNFEKTKKNKRFNSVANCPGDADIAFTIRSKSGARARTLQRDTVWGIYSRLIFGCETSPLQKSSKNWTKSCLTEKKGKWWRQKVIKIWRETEETGGSSRRRRWSNGETIMPCLRRWSYIIESLNWLSILLCDIKATSGICREQRMCIQREETARAVNYLGVLWVLHVKWMTTESLFSSKVLEYSESCQTFYILPSGFFWAMLPQYDIDLCVSLFISDVSE